MRNVFSFCSITAVFCVCSLLGLAARAYEVENLTKLTDGPIGESGCTFNTSGTKIAYRNLHSPYFWANCDIWVMNIDGSGKAQITTDSRGEFDPRFAPDGRITYNKEFGSNDYDLWIVNADGSSPHLLIGGPYRQTLCRWHHNGNEIVYSSEYQWGGPLEIWTADSDGFGKIRLTDHAVDGYGQNNPVYSRSGNLIAYANYATSSANANIWVMNSDGSGKHQITFDTSGQNPMFWWPDDSRIGYVQDGDLWLHNFSTSKDELLPISMVSGNLGWCDLSPDGTKLVFDWADVSGQHIWIGDVTSGSQEPELVVFDTGFLPSVHGFDFANWGSIGDWYGHCVGMTFAAFNYFRLEIDPASCPEWINKLYIEWLQLKYLAATSFLNMVDTLLQGQIPMSSTEVQTQYAAIRWLIEQGVPCPIIMAKETTLESHAVLAYKIIEISTPEVTYHQVYIYDNVYPGENLLNLQIEERNGTWKFGSDGAYQRFFVVNTSQIEASVNDFPLLLTLYSPVTLRITDPDGLTLAEDQSEIDGAYYRIIDTDADGHDEQLAIFLWPKEGSHYVEVIPNPNALTTDTYSLEVTSGSKTVILAENIPIKDIPPQPYIIRVTEDGIVPIIPATVDFNPDTLNLKSKGKWITCYIELPVGHGYETEQIDVTSLMLNSQIGAEAHPTEIGDYDSDRIPDLMVKFDRQAVAQMLEAGIQKFYLTGQLSDGTLFTGMDMIRVLTSKGGKDNKGNKGSKKAASGFNMAGTEENLEPTDDDAASEAFEPEEAIGFMLFEAGAIIEELGPASFNSEESAVELANGIDFVFAILDEGMYFEALAVLETDILQRTDGCANIGKPDENDWITSFEGQALVYPLVLETIELIESLI